MQHGRTVYDGDETCVCDGGVYVVRRGARAVWGDAEMRDGHRGVRRLYELKPLRRRRWEADMQRNDEQMRGVRGPRECAGRVRDEEWGGTWM